MLHNCPQCGTEFKRKEGDSYFDSERCKELYWGKVGIDGKPSKPKTLKEIQEGLKRLQSETKHIEPALPAPDFIESEEDLLSFADRIFDEQGITI